MSEASKPAQQNLAFITCIERGSLEEQSLLLYQSIRQFGGRFRDSPIYAYCPRADRGVTPATIAAMEKLNVVYRDAPLNRELDYFAYANKNFAAADVERTSSHETLVFLDSDTIFLREPQLLELPENVDVRVRPVDEKGICSSGPNDPFEDYWHELARLCHVNLTELPFVNATVRGIPVRANYNGGLVSVRSGVGIFSRWQENILAAHHADLRPREKSFWGSGQSTLAMAIHAATSRIELLPTSYNYPLHRHDELVGERQVGASRDLTHLHYHKMLEPSRWPRCALAQQEFEWEPELRDWLFAKVPLAEKSPPIDHGVRPSKPAKARSSGWRSRIRQLLSRPA